MWGFCVIKRGGWGNGHPWSPPRSKKAQSQTKRNSQEASFAGKENWNILKATSAHVLLPPPDRRTEDPKKGAATPSVQKLPLGRFCLDDFNPGRAEGSLFGDIAVEKVGSSSVLAWRAGCVTECLALNRIREQVKGCLDASKREPALELRKAESWGGQPHITGTIITVYKMQLTNICHVPGLSPWSGDLR